MTLTIATDTLVRFNMYWVCVCVSVFLACDTVAVPIGPHSSRLVFYWQGVRLADVHPVLFCLQVLVVAFVVIVVLGLAVVGGGVAGQSWRGRHRGWSGVTETRSLRRRIKRN